MWKEKKEYTLNTMINLNGIEKFIFVKLRVCFLDLRNEVKDLRSRTMRGVKSYPIMNMTFLE